MATGNTLLDDRTRIEASIKAFHTGALAKNAVKFFDALGYRSERTEDLEPNTAEGLLELVNRPDFFNRVNARPEEWASIDLLFQLTDEEVRGHAQTSLDFDSKRLDIDSDRSFQSYLFFAVRLKKASYSRNALADITREINRFFDMPALVLFQHGGKLTLAVVNRRLHKRDPARDVLEKVTLVKDIRVENPHRAHVEILLDLAFQWLTVKHKITNFVELHDAWRKTLDISELNKRFYRDLSNWYFWAREQVEFPARTGVTDEGNRATNVIRLITRLTFVWFLKERRLVPDELFRRETLETLLTDLSPESSTFYKAVLQNLFFATLNTPMNDPASPREFRTDTDGKRHNEQHMVHNHYRHKRLFRDPETALAMFASVPFLNGGLFECLDKREEVNGKTVETRMDGFSDVESRQPAVPNRLFFCEEHNCADDGVDLNAVYDTRNKQYKVRGLIDTLDRYKFTVAENTPIDEEVALDPELLGKVFENLLASYNPETGATARKQTGSFYTPREIVNYMVDESLIAYLETRLAPGVESEGETLSSRLRRLFAYTDEPHGFAEAEVEKLIGAIDGVKILDPACGSGAYPMGILGKLVFILSKLDPQNARWKRRQIDRVREAMRAAEKIDDDKLRESTLQDLKAQVGNIEEAFKNNELDYGRKLFLIENCIYGVDIQPIAIQISKLRFFISLVIDQRIRPEAENLGIRPLPNLETKFVAANALLGIEKPAQSMLRNEELRRAVEEKESELKIVRERHFTARTTRAKEKYRKEDERLRREIGRLLEDDNWSPETTEKLVRWNPYDQNTTADFFDAEWMFGVVNGFDVVIANPPYVFARDSKQKGFTAESKQAFYKNYTLAEYQLNLYPLFIEQGHRLLNRRGVLCFITPNNWMTINTNTKLRRFVLNQSGIVLVNFYARVFESADVDSSIIMFRKDGADKQVRLYEYVDSFSLITQRDAAFFLGLTDHIINVEAFKESGTTDLLLRIEAKSDRLGDVATVKAGLKAYEVGKGVPPQTKEMKDARVYHGTKNVKGALKYLDGKDVCRYSIQWSGEFLVYGENLAAPRKDFGLFSTPRILVRQIPSKPPYCINACFITEVALNDLNSINVTNIRLPPEFVLGVLNSKLISYWFVHKFGKMQRGIFPQFKVNELAQFPIAGATKQQREEIAKLVDRILAAKRKEANDDTATLEREIDRLVYQLYELTPDEIEVVEATAQR